MSSIKGTQSILAPLKNSFARDLIEDDIREIALILFKNLIADNALDANVLGAPYLGSINLIRMSMVFDGLEVARAFDDADESARYLFRAWKSGNNQGRGFHFLRTYLSMLFGSDWGVMQYEQDSAVSYPTRLYARKEFPINHYDSVAYAPLDVDTYLTSRINIFVNGENINSSMLTVVKDSIAAILPAKIVPSFSIFRSAKTSRIVGSSGSAAMQINSYGTLKD